MKSKKVLRLKQDPCFYEIIKTKDDPLAGAVGGGRTGDTGLRELFPLSNSDCFSTSMDQNIIVNQKTCSM